MKAETIQAVKEVLKTETRPGERPDAASMVIIIALIAVEQVDALWEDKEIAGAPSVTDYAEQVVNMLRGRYGNGRTLR